MALELDIFRAKSKKIPDFLYTEVFDKKKQLTFVRRSSEIPGSLKMREVPKNNSKFKTSYKKIFNRLQSTEKLTLFGIISMFNIF